MNSSYGLWKPQKSKLLLAVPACILLMCMYYLYAVAGTEANDRPLVSTWKYLSPREQASNSTLGFQKILALSAGTSWRTRGLEAAARIAKIDVSVPTQPFISDEIVKAFELFGANDPNTKLPPHGSAKAWLAHLDLIKFVVASGFETVLIVEDDVDWDVTIRDQMALLSDNVRTFQNTDHTDTTPYGSKWDVLWIGHCGEVTPTDIIKSEYRDESLVPTELYAGWSKKYLTNIQEGYRVIQKTKQTVCTFGYGISRVGAQNILRQLSHGQNEAFDIALMTACQQEHLRCISVNPELMHHYNPKDGAGYVSSIAEANGQGQSFNEQAFELLRGTTANMKDSARCAALFHDTCLQPPTRAEDY